MSDIKYEYEKRDIFRADSDHNRICKIHGFNGMFKDEPEYCIQFVGPASEEHPPDAFIDEGSLKKHYSKFEGYIVIAKVES